AECGEPFRGAAYRERSPALLCRRHASTPRTAIAAATLATLRELHAAPGRQLPAIAVAAAHAPASALVGHWLHWALEQRLRFRAHVFVGREPAARAAAPAPDASSS